MNDEHSLCPQRDCRQRIDVIEMILEVLEEKGRDVHLTRCVKKRLVESHPR
jgi:hypothetical protein